MKILRAEISDAREILELQKLAYKSEAKIYNNYSIPPLIQTLEEIKLEFRNKTFLKAIENNKLIGSVRANHNNHACFIGKLIVHPSYQNQGLGARLLNEIEKTFEHVFRYELFTGVKSRKNLYLYVKLGYTIFKTEQLSDNLHLAFLEKYSNRNPLKL